ncbi:type II toxin-antitoxin system RelE/ParE family toxin [Flavobacterium sp. UBA4197]|uniref:type II toxin-antitoxin system RelE/ParE family toxin n=1 Tax=Flavobacterium sp. UBA4197 TaxID=1946546 RepID=UPI0025808A62|nr:type II toxin-antitoxin system RelE/ParE family toxin [Flavobacterium sp. UBA4197]
MAKFYLTNKAVEDLGDIWNYTVETWSENQAEIYYSLIIDSFQELASKPNQGKSYDVVERNVLGYKTGQHVIFHRIVTEREIEVIRISHGMMDMKNHL